MPQSSYTKDELIECGKGNLFGPGNAKLPVPPMLMFDRITEVSAEGGAHGKGFIKAELDVNPDLWFFQCHFIGDPVMPGCLGLDAVWQLLGFYLGWSGAPGSGRALGLGELKLSAQILPETKRVEYVVDIKRLINRKLVLGIGDGKVFADGELACEVTDLRVGLFENPRSL
ncbi:MAG TPA: bifunctional 3-hydroxydecanoyl-ACP dehydratase/trans-2-decenoyl-ACP isomerase [Alphaproteobacteria bacterium]